MNCGLADKGFDLLVEVTALRAKLHEQQNEVAEREEELKRKVKEKYKDVVMDLFNNALHMDQRFHKFKLKLHDDTLEQVGHH